MSAEKIRRAISSLNKIKFCGLRRYKMGTALGIAISDGLRQLSWSKAFKSLLFGCIICDFDIGVSGGGRLVFLFSPSYMDRKLLRDDFLGIAGLMTDSKVAVANRRKATLDFTKLLYLIFYPIWILQMISVPLSIKQKFNLIGRIASCKKWENLISGKIVDSSTSLLTVFSDGNMYDNITAQYCRFKSISAATLQHGIIYDTPTSSYFESGFELFVSDKLLVWGRETKKKALQSGIDPKRIYVAGIYRQTKKIKQAPDIPIFGVMLSGSPQYMDQTNTRLLMIANELAERRGLKYIVKGHPAREFTYRHLCKKDFLSYVCDPEISIFDMAEKAQFFICVSASSIAYDLINIGAVVFIHKNLYENYFYSDIEKLCFENLGQLFELVKWANENEIEYRQVADKISQDIFDSNTLDKYRLFFKQYLK